jgi:hypothetical protein
VDDAVPVPFRLTLDPSSGVVLVWEAGRGVADLYDRDSDEHLRRVRRKLRVTAARLLWRPPGGMGWYAISGQGPLTHARMPHAEDSSG